jgi:hypothetical protein
MQPQHDYAAVAENRHLVDCPAGGCGIFRDINPSAAARLPALKN